MQEIKFTVNKILWTKHAQNKVKEYGLSESRVKRVLRHPDRVEQGLSEGTSACMQKAGSKKHPTEIWAMYKVVGEAKKVISVWRYPGVTKLRDPIPEEILDEIKQLYD